MVGEAKKVLHRPRDELETERCGASVVPRQPLSSPGPSHVGGGSLDSAGS